MSARGGCRFVFQGVGTRGDIAPLVAIGAEMTRRGHECHLLANAAYREDAAAAGLRFFPITEQTEIFWGAERDNPENYFFPCLRAVGAYFREHLDGTRRTVVVNTDRRYASNLWSERHELPTVRLYLTPVLIRSLAAPTYPLAAGAGGCFAHTFRTYYLPRHHDRYDRNALRLATINARRWSVGLPPVDDASYVEPYVRRRLALFPAWYAPPAEDWPYGTRCIGFPFVEPSARLPAALEEFIAREGPPVVFTPGTCTPNEVALFHAGAIASSDALGVPVVFLSPYVPAGRRGARGRVLALDYVDLGLFLDRAAALVHHGGIGTTAQALRAGVPQLVLPNRFDQPDNGRRIEKLGVGAVLPRSGATAATVAEAVARILSDDGCRTRLRPLREELKTGRAVERAGDVLEALGAGRPEPRGGNAGPEPRGGNAGPERRRVLFVAWPDAEDLLAPAALARALEERGDRVFVGGASYFGPHVRSLGLEHVDLSGPSDWGQRWSLFDPLPHRAALREAVERFVATFDATIRRCRPSVVLFDSRYSGLGILAEVANLPWAIYERDVPRELDPAVPPPQAMVVPDPGPAMPDVIRTAWRNQLAYALWARRRERSAALPYDWSRIYFATAIVDELERRFGRRVSFHRFTSSPPIARVDRMVFCPRPFDFARARPLPRCDWVGACIDERRAEPDLDCADLPPGRPLAYAAFGEESLAHPAVGALLGRLVDAFARRDDFSLVLVCPDDRLRPRLRTSAPSVRIVEKAPRLALLRRAGLAITDGSFARIKECAAAGVPTIAIALSPDQRRHAALVAHLGLGAAIDGSAAATAEGLGEIIGRVGGSALVGRRCARAKRWFERDAGAARALAFVDRLLGAARAPRAGEEPARVALHAPAHPERVA